MPIAFFDGATVSRPVLTSVDGQVDGQGRTYPSVPLWMSGLRYSATMLSGGAQELAGTRSRSRSDSRMNAGMSAG